MNASQIEARMRKYKQFRGVFSCDRIPHFTRGGVIVNTDPSGQPGTHWIALYLSGDGRGEYFDSFAAPPLIPQIILFIAKNCPRGCTYNTTPIQRLTSDTCGRFAIGFLLCKFKGETFQHIASKINTTEELALQRLESCGDLHSIVNRD